MTENKLTSEVPLQLALQIILLPASWVDIRLCILHCANVDSVWQLAVIFRRR